MNRIDGLNRQKKLEDKIECFNALTKEIKTTTDTRQLKLLRQKRRKILKEV